MFTMFPTAVQMPPLMTCALVVVLALAVREDLLRHRIPNALNMASVILGFGLATLVGGVSGAIHSVGGALVGCAALIPFYLLRGMGAGDVKLMGSTGAFLGPSGALLAAALALIAGAVLGIAIVLWRLVEPKPLLETSPLVEGSGAWRVVATIMVARRERFPYAVAIAVGVITTLWLRGYLGALFSALGIG